VRAAAARTVAAAGAVSRARLAGARARRRGGRPGRGGRGRGIVMACLLGCTGGGQRGERPGGGRGASPPFAGRESRPVSAGAVAAGPRATRPPKDPGGGEPPHLQKSGFRRCFSRAAFQESERRPPPIASVIAFSALFRRLHRALWLIPSSAAIRDRGILSRRLRPIRRAWAGDRTPRVTAAARTKSGWPQGMYGAS